VALLDFDVHHGNGTQACVGNTVPSLASYAFQTPLSKGSQVFPRYKPWVDFDDADNILFARCAARVPFLVAQGPVNLLQCLPCVLLGPSRPVVDAQPHMLCRAMALRV
jgi:hypothetical protein